MTYNVFSGTLNPTQSTILRTRGSCVCVSAVGPCDVQQQSLSTSSTLESTTYSAGQESSGTGACDGQLSCRPTSSFTDVTCLPRSNVLSSTALNADSNQVKTAACLNPS